MATVNIAQNTWLENKDTDTIGIMTYSSLVYFEMGSAKTNEMAFAKACVAIDADKYDSITFTYSKRTKSGYISNLRFGIFNDMSLPYIDAYGNEVGVNSDEIVIKTGGWKNSGDSVTVDISDLTGTKYVGFLFYGNTHTVNGALILQEVEISSLAAVESGYTLTYNANGGSGAPDLVNNITSTTISSTEPTRDGYEFLGWSTSPTGVQQYVAGSTILLTSDVTLYAVWIKVYTITFDANGGDYASAPEQKMHGVSYKLYNNHVATHPDASVTYMVTFNANGGSCDIDMTTITNVVTYKFSHWNTASDGLGTSYKIGDSYTDNSDITLYAQYELITTYKSITLPTPTRSNYEFLGWSTDEYATSGITGEYTPTSDIALYATWKCRGNVYIYDDAGGFNPYQVWIYDDSGWNQYIPYIYTENGWEVYSG